jgi:hypothetical protein
MQFQPHTIKHYISNKHARKNGQNLSLFIDNEFFMYAIFTPDDGGLVELCHVRMAAQLQPGTDLEERLRFMISNHQLAPLSYGSVNIAVLNSQFTILPEAYALKETSRHILGFSSGEQPKNSFTHQFNNMSFNYSMDSGVLQLLEKTFRNASIRHAGAVSVNLLFNNRSLKNCDVFVNFNEGVFELMAREESRLLYYNVFNYDTNEDLLYYPLFMMEQFGLDPQKSRLVIAGVMDTEAHACKLIKKYVKQVGFAVNDSNVSKSLGELKVPDHFYFTLLNQHLCEL